jgi:hypothetical protein
VTNGYPDYTEKTANKYYVAAYHFKAEKVNPPVSLGSLTVTKTVTGMDSLPGGYSVDVTVKDSDNKEQTRTISFSGPDKDGNYTGSTTFTGLTAGEYTVEESPEDITGYTLSSVKAGGTDITETKCTDVTVVKDDTASVNLVNTYLPTTTSFSFDKIWDGAIGNRIRVTLSDGKYNYSVNVPSAKEDTYTTSHTVDGHTWRCTVSGLPYLTSGSYTVASETAIDGYTSTIIPAGSASISSVRRITTCKALTIRNIGSPFMVIQSQGKYYLWTAADLHEDVEALAAAIADEPDADNFKNIQTKSYTYLSGTQTLGSTCKKLEGTVISSDSTGTVITFKDESAWSNLLVGRYDAASDTPRIINSQSAVSESYTGTLQITKELSGGISAGDLSNDSFEFQVYAGSNTSGDPVRSGSVEAGKTLTFDDLAGGTYTIVETRPGVEKNYTFSDVSYSGDGFTDGGTDSQSCTIDFHPTAQDETFTVTATNNYQTKTGSLTVGNTVENKTGDTTKFTFAVQVGSGSTSYDSTTTYAGDGVYTYKLQDGGSFTLTGIPYGTHYTVTETENDAYTTCCKANGAEEPTDSNSCSGTISSSAAEQAVAFINHYITQGFTVTKEDTDNHAVLLSGAEFQLNGINLPNGSETVETNNAGVAFFTDIPAGTYTLTESQAPKDYEGSTTQWTVTVSKDGVTFEKVSEDGLATLAASLVKAFSSSPSADDFAVDGNNLTVYNTHETGQLTINKIVSVNGGTLPENYSVTFNAYDKTAYEAWADKKDLKGLTVYGTVTLSGKNDLRDGTGTTTMNLNTGDYEVVETVSNGPSAAGYNTLNETGAADVTVTTNGGTAGFINSYAHKTGSLQVTLVVSEADYKLLGKKDGFTFTVGNTKVTIARSDLTKNSETGDYSCTTTLLSDVNTGSYSITEKSGYDVDGYDVDGYAATITSSSGTGTSTISGDSTISVPVTDSAEPTTVTFINHYAPHYGESVYNSASFRVYKTDKDGKAIIPGGDITQSAAFTLYDEDGKQVGDSQTIDSTGYASFSGLEGGTEEDSKTYLLKETTVPTGYTQNNADGWTITIEKNQVADIEPNSGNNNVFQKVFNWFVDHVSGGNGTFAAADKSAPATLTVKNTRVDESTIPGTLTITKDFSGLPDGVRPDAIQMTVSNSDGFKETITLDGTADTTKTDGWQEISPWTAEVSVPAAGTYTVTEDSDSGNTAGDYHRTETTYSGSGTAQQDVMIESSNDFPTNVTTVGTGAITVTNTYARNTADLTVTKVINHTLPLSFEILVRGEGRTYALGLAGSGNIQAPTASTANSYTWTLNVPTGDYTAAERNYVVSGYSVAVTATGGQYETSTGTLSFAVASAAETGETAAVRFVNSYRQSSTPYAPGSDDDNDNDNDNDTPIVIPDNPTPLNPTPGITVAIPNGDIPQADVPNTEISDEDVPLALVPSTGDNIILWAMAAAVSGVGLIGFAIAGRKRRDDNAR